MFSKRLLAYIIDVIILGVILCIICSFIPTSRNSKRLNDELFSVAEDYFDNKVEFNTFINRYSSISYNLSRELFLSDLIGVIVGFLYYVVFPLCNKGQSIGKKIMHIGIVSNDGSQVSSNGLVVRYLLMCGLGTSILSMCMIFILKDFNYFVFVSILSFLQILVVIISVFMVLYRNDSKSLPDLIAGTSVIEVK